MGTLRVAVIEDDFDSREAMRLLLEEAGHAVTEAGDGAAGVRLILEGAPDIALVDVGLADVDGYEVARRVRAAGSTVCLVALTGYGHPDDRRAALAAGFDAHLVKPLEFRTLLDVMTSLDALHRRAP
jgi:DNA-binding response OmpR family regulator